MKLLQFAAVILLSVSMASCSDTVSVITQAHKTTHVLIERTITGNTAKCGSTAIGPHALLTVSHCELPTSAIMVDDKIATVKSIMRDGHDHTIYLLDGVEFKDWVEMNASAPEVGTDVFIFGSPGKHYDLLRKGTVVGYEPLSVQTKDQNDKEPVLLLDLNGYYGDSGAGLFDSKGRLIGVISIKLEESRESDEQSGAFKLAGCFAIAFSKQQLDAAQKWQTVAAQPSMIPLPPGASQ